MKKIEENNNCNKLFEAMTIVIVSLVLILVFFHREIHYYISPGKFISKIIKEEYTKIEHNFTETKNTKYYFCEKTKMKPNYIMKNQIWYIKNNLTSKIHKLAAIATVENCIEKANKSISKEKTNLNSYKN